jgi:hypothetical protein
MARRRKLLTRTVRKVLVRTSHEEQSDKNFKEETYSGRLIT